MTSQREEEWEEEEEEPGTSSARILLDTRERRGLPRLSKSDSSLECTQSPQATLLRGSNSCKELPQPSNVPSSSSCISIDSTSSGYTSESSYQTATAASTSHTSFFSQLPTEEPNYLQEIHVAIEANASSAQVDAIRSDLRSLLSNELQLIEDSSLGGRRAIYLIAYRYM